MSEENQRTRNRSAETQFPKQRNANRSGSRPRKDATMGDLMQEKIQIRIRRGKPVYTTREKMMFEQQISNALDGNHRAIEWVLDRFHQERVEEHERLSRNQPKRRTRRQQQAIKNFQNLRMEPLLALERDLIARGVIVVRQGVRRIADEISARVAASKKPEENGRGV